MRADDVVDGPLDFILEWFRRFEEWCPGILGKVLSFLVDIPEGDERAMLRLSEAYEDAAKALSDHLGVVAAMSQEVSEAWSGDGAAAEFRNSYGGYIEQVSNEVVGLYSMRQMTESAGVEFEMMKFMAAINLYMLASALVAILSTLIVSLGTSSFAAPAAEAACQTGIRAAARKLLAKLLGEKFAGSVGRFVEIAGKELSPNAVRLGERGGVRAARPRGGRWRQVAAHQGRLEEAGRGGLERREGRRPQADPKDLAARIAARDIAERAGTEFFERAGMGAGKLRTIVQVATGRGGERVAARGVQQLVKREAYRNALENLGTKGSGEVFKAMGQAALGRAKGFALFNVKTTFGLGALQVLEGHTPQIDVVSFRRVHRQVRGDRRLRRPRVGHSGPRRARRGRVVRRRDGRRRRRARGPAGLEGRQRQEDEVVRPRGPVAEGRRWRPALRRHGRRAARRGRRTGAAPLRQADGRPARPRDARRHRGDRPARRDPACRRAHRQVRSAGTATVPEAHTGGDVLAPGSDAPHVTTTGDGGAAHTGGDTAPPSGGDRPSTGTPHPDGGDGGPPTGARGRPPVDLAPPAPAGHAGGRGARRSRRRRPVRGTWRPVGTVTPRRGRTSRTAGTATRARGRRTPPGERDHARCRTGPRHGDHPRRRAR